MCVCARAHKCTCKSTESGPSGSAQGFKGASYFALNYFWIWSWTLFQIQNSSDLCIPQCIQHYFSFRHEVLSLMASREPKRSEEWTTDNLEQTQNCFVGPPGHTSHLLEGVYSPFSCQVLPGRCRMSRRHLPNACFSGSSTVKKIGHWQNSIPYYTPNQSWKHQLMQNAELLLMW